MKKIIIISGKNAKLVNALVLIFIQKGYTLASTFSNLINKGKNFGKWPDKWVIANITKYSTMSVSPTILQIQEAGIKATVHYIDINSWGTFGAKIDFNF